MFGSAVYGVWSVLLEFHGLQDHCLGLPMMALVLSGLCGLFDCFSHCHAPFPVVRLYKTSSVLSRHVTISCGLARLTNCVPVILFSASCSCVGVFLPEL